MTHHAPASHARVGATAASPKASDAIAAACTWAAGTVVAPNARSMVAQAMDSRGVPPDMGLRRDIARLLVDRLNDDLIAPLAAATPDVVHIDSRGILPRDGNYRDDWSNELHPTNLGFRRVFEQAWLPRLFEHGIAIRPAP